MRTSKDIWQRFVVLPGSTVDGQVGIASEQAIKGLIKAIRRYRPITILELGAGIGTLTFTILETVSELNVHEQSGFVFWTIENNEFCLEELARNLKDYEGMFQVADSPQAVRDKNICFDLIVVDGGGDMPNDMGPMDFSGMLAEGGAVLVEGYPLFQRQSIERWYGKRPNVSISMAALRQTIRDKHTKRIAKNKSYHLFVFEPTLLDRLRLTAMQLLNVGYVWLPRRVLRALASIFRST